MMDRRLFERMREIAQCAPRPCFTHAETGVDLRLAAGGYIRTSYAHGIKLTARGRAALSDTLLVLLHRTAGAEMPPHAEDR